MEKVRIKDIAKMADVSVGTVDRVIHGRSGVSESSRKRVEEDPETTGLPAQYVCQCTGFEQEVRICLPAATRERRILDRRGNGHTQRRRDLL